jgi:predicted HAD superfamily Cof-like phosphohydrolase
MIGTSTNYAALVFAFMAKHRQPVMRSPSLVPEELSSFRIRLIEEEVSEIKTAVESGDLVLIADGIADLLYVTFGLAVTYGIPIDSIFEEVHRSNMTKERIRVEGNEMKVGKGPTYSPPKIKPIIDQCIRMIEGAKYKC